MKKLLLILTILILIAGCSSTKSLTGSAIADAKEQQEAALKESEQTTEKTEEQQEEPIEIEQEVQEINYSINIVDMKFEPSLLTVPAGATVVWTHNDDYALKHMILIKGEEKSDYYLFKGDTYEYTFTKPGTYSILDPIYLETAIGQIIVE